MHGGHNFNTLDIAVSEVNRILRMKVHIASVDLLYNTFRDDLTKLLHEGIHPEVAMMLAVNPTLVKERHQPQAVAASFPDLMSIGRYYDPEYTLDKIAPHGFVSHSEKATSAIGEILLDKTSSALAEQVLKQINK